MISSHAYSSRLNDGMRGAAECAEEVYESLKKESCSHVENLFIMELSAIVIKAIENLESNTSVSHEYFDRILRYASKDAPTKLLKVGYSLTVLLQKLLLDRVNDRNAISHLTSYSTRRTFNPTIVRTSKSSPIKITVSANAVHSHEEMREVKEEPLDEDELFEPEDRREIKQEEVDYQDVKEEPLVDVFCPTTGSSRPLSLDDLLCNERMDRFENLEESPCTVQPGVDDGWYTPMTNDDSYSAPSTSTARIPQAPKLFSGNGQQCHLCEKHIVQFYTTVNLGKLQRNKLLNAVRIQNPQDRARVAALRPSDRDAYFCISHVIASKVPSVQPMTCRTPVMYKPTLPKPAVPNRAGRCKCDLCDDPEYPIRISPGTTARAKRFFQNLIDLTSAQKEKVKCFIAKAEKEARICSKHFRKEDEMPTLYVEDPSAKVKDETKFAYDLKKMALKFQPY